MEQYSVCKEFSFDAAHRLHNLPYESKCKNVHGHKYFITLRIFTEELNEAGMVIDFTHFKEFEDYLDDVFDHAIICDQYDNELHEAAAKLESRHVVISYDLTTSENLAKHFWNVSNEMFGHLGMEIEVTIHETPKNYATYRKEC